MYFLRASTTLPPEVGVIFGVIVLLILAIKMIIEQGENNKEHAQAIIVTLTFLEKKNIIVNPDDVFASCNLQFKNFKEDMEKQKRVGIEHVIKIKYPLNISTKILLNEYIKYVAALTKKIGIQPVEFRGKRYLDNNVEWTNAHNKTKIYFEGGKILVISNFTNASVFNTSANLQEKTLLAQ